MDRRTGPLTEKVVQYLLAKYNLELWTVSLHPAAVQAARVLFFSLHKLKMDIEKLASLLLKEPAIWFPRKEASGSAGDTSTFPRRARLHSVAISKFSYLESGAKDKSLGSQYFRQEVTASLIRSLVYGLNTTGVSPAAPAAATAATTPTLPLHESITVRLVNLRPGSPSSPSPMVPCLHSTDWPPTTLAPACSSPRLQWQQGGKGAKNIPSEPKNLHGSRSSRSSRSPRVAVWPPLNKPTTSDHLGTLPRSRSRSLSPASPHIPVARYTPAPPKNPVPPNTPDVPRIPASHRPSHSPHSDLHAS
ncbi:hypothetical protein O3P69_003327 [Scylla paramamosain]|uniref:Uncharacterized protein n=1 Tax=Scylla paramamosain TaxID=85552 RepID=A0AAW0UQU3_SCYPA